MIAGDNRFRLPLPGATPSPCPFLGTGEGVRPGDNHPPQRQAPGASSLFGRFQGATPSRPPRDCEGVRPGDNHPPNAKHPGASLLLGVSRVPHLRVPQRTRRCAAWRQSPPQRQASWPYSLLFGVSRVRTPSRPRKGLCRCAAWRQSPPQRQASRHKLAFWSFPGCHTLSRPQRDARCAAWRQSPPQRQASRHKLAFWSFPEVQRRPAIQKKLFFVTFVTLWLRFLLPTVIIPPSCPKSAPEMLNSPTKTLNLLVKTDLKNAVFFHAFSIRFCPILSVLVRSGPPELT